MYDIMDKRPEHIVTNLHVNIWSLVPQLWILGLISVVSWTILNGHLLHGQKLPKRRYSGQLLPRPLPLNIPNLTKIRFVVPEKWLLWQMLLGKISPGQVSPGQMLHGQLSQGQLLPGQLLIVQILTGFGQSWRTSFVKIEWHSLDKATWTNVS